MASSLQMRRPGAQGQCRSLGACHSTLVSQAGRASAVQLGKPGCRLVPRVGWQTLVCVCAHARVSLYACVRVQEGAPLQH